MERHAYINIEPDNGGIVLNVSDGGLCFHSFDPVKPNGNNGKIRFWFSDQNQRIEADGTLAWTDETQKGGLRFNALPAEAREKIRDWIKQPATPLPADAGSAATPSRAVPPFNGSWNTKATPSSPEARVPIQLSGFSRGLATGLMVSVLVAGGFLFNGYRREVGVWLIHLGERFAAKPEPQISAVQAASPVVSPEPQPTSPSSATVSPAPQIVQPAPQAVLAEQKTIAPTPAPIPAPQAENIPPQPEKLVPQASSNTGKLQQAKVEAVEPLPAPAAALPSSVSNPAPKPTATVASTAVSLKPTTPSVPTPAPAPPVAAASNLVAAKLDTTPKQQPVTQPSALPAVQSAVHTEESGPASPATNAAATSELFFEVGKFKNPTQAHDETDKLAQLGFPVSAVQKGFLWTNSYHVLVGPYGDENHAKTTHDSLVSEGFKPRTFERGSRDFTLGSPVVLGGARTPEGDYIIRWESYVGNATVKFQHNNSTVAEADGKWVKHDAKYPHNAYMYRRNPDGSRTLLEIHFEGMREALVF
jgi:cell division protein FtsN